MLHTWNLGSCKVGHTLEEIVSHLASLGELGDNRATPVSFRGWHGENQM